jgi:hypothetical protein
MANTKDLDAVLDYCCFTVAFVMAYFHIDNNNMNELVVKTLFEKLNLYDKAIMWCNCELARQSLKSLICVDSCCSHPVDELVDIPLVADTNGREIMV